MKSSRRILSYSSNLIDAKLKNIFFAFIEEGFLNPLFFFYSSYNFSSFLEPYLSNPLQEKKNFTILKLKLKNINNNIKNIT